MVTTHSIQSIAFDKDFIYLTVDGKDCKILLDKISQKLKNASDMERKLYTISPTGYGIHWPLIDEDLAVDSILNCM